MIDQGDLRWHALDDYGEVFDGGEIPVPRFDSGMSEFSYDHEVEAPWYHHWSQRRTYEVELEGDPEPEGVIETTEVEVVIRIVDG